MRLPPLQRDLHILLILRLGLLPEIFLKPTSNHFASLKVRQDERQRTHRRLEDRWFPEPREGPGVSASTTMLLDQRSRQGFPIKLLVACAIFISGLEVLSHHDYLPIIPWASLVSSGASLRPARDPPFTATGPGVEDHVWGLPPADHDISNPALLEAPQVLVSSPDTCAQALAVPKVALLFLTQGAMHHAEAWALWFASAAGHIPLANLRQAGCDAWHRSILGPLGACDSSVGPKEAAELDPEDIIGAQHLFSVYLHVPLDRDVLQVHPLFRKHLISRRTTTTWGSPTLSIAMRYLLWEAYRDPLNERFALVSESGLPIYSPVVFYQQLMAEQDSRVDGCKSESIPFERFVPAMESAALKRWHWRKTMQWFMLTRDHAGVVLEDTHVFRQFERYCFHDAVDDKGNRHFCLMDEHYLAVLFAVHGIQAATNCGARSLTKDDWTMGGSHPKTFRSHDVNPELIKWARSEEGIYIPKYGALTPPPFHCNHTAAILSANAAMGTLAGASVRQVCDRSGSGGMLDPLSSRCRLTVRKVAGDAASKAVELFKSCAPGLELVHPDLCQV
uniref:Uncharacterized protein n=1 Tax=Auxenochlorella protothecoides TaxID=3075 RepID=A0A1D1ZP04_AUXPR